MAKDKKATKAKTGKPKAAAPAPAEAKPHEKSTAKKVKDKTLKLASNPLVAEVVAATLVAAAAALRNPQKARELAESAADELSTAGKRLGDEIGTAGKQVAGRGSELWNLALDVARRTVEAVENDAGVKKKATKKKKK